MCPFGSGEERVEKPVKIWHTKGSEGGEANIGCVSIATNETLLEAEQVRQSNSSRMLA
jgi:hypothetical protein